MNSYFPHFSISAGPMPNNFWTVQTPTPPIPEKLTVQVIQRVSATVFYSDPNTQLNENKKSSNNK